MQSGGNSSEFLPDYLNDCLKPVEDGKQESVKMKTNEEQTQYKLVQLQGKTFLLPREDFDGVRNNKFDLDSYEFFSSPWGWQMKCEDGTQSLV